MNVQPDQVVNVQPSQVVNVQPYPVVNVQLCPVVNVQPDPVVNVQPSPVVKSKTKLFSTVENTLAFSSHSNLSKSSGLPFCNTLCCTSNLFIFFYLFKLINNTQYKDQFLLCNNYFKKYLHFIKPCVYLPKYLSTIILSKWI